MPTADCRQALGAWGRLDLFRRTRSNKLSGNANSGLQSFRSDLSVLCARMYSVALPVLHPYTHLACPTGATFWPRSTSQLTSNHKLKEIIPQFPWSLQRWRNHP